MVGDTYFGSVLKPFAHAQIVSIPIKYRPLKKYSSPDLVLLYASIK
jgi:hypothetical protein